MPLPFVNEQEQVKIPVGGDFIPSGMIGLWRAQVMFGFWTETDPGMDDALPKPDAIFKRGRGFQLYWKSSEIAEVAKTAYGQEYAPKQTWVYSTANGKVLNVADAETLKKFSDPIVFDNCAITSLQSKKHRHQLHFIALPAAVHAAAVTLGYKVPDISFNDLISNQAIFTDEFQVKMIGGESSYDESQLWLQRAALWNALEESDARKYYPVGSNTKYDTGSKKLSECLSVLTREWKSPVWSRVVQVPDPRVDAVYGDESKRLAIPALMEIFASEAVARKAAETELAERAQRNTAKENGTAEASSNGSVPVAWHGMESDWETLRGQLKAEYAGKPEKMVKAQLAKRGEEIGVQADEVNAVYASLKA